jgi:AP-3 complex subunit beta
MWLQMISKGRDASSMFPDVVKNVVCNSLEVKKLVYIFVTHYAEVEPDAALLAIATFQKDLKDQNPLIRAHVIPSRLFKYLYADVLHLQALRVLSSIRLRVITPVLIVAIQKACTDSSPYVRKSAAHALSKVSK